MPADPTKSSGFLLIDKPAGITSHDVVDRVRRITGERRVGHAGTLDPFATGLLVVGVGREATKRLSEFLGQNKEYAAVAVLGATSDTQDRTGVIETPDTRHETRNLDEVAIREAMREFVGEIEQVPPMYSAKKIAGKKLYELARAGQTVERQPVKIRIHELEFLRLGRETEKKGEREEEQRPAISFTPSDLSPFPPFPLSSLPSLPHLTFRVRCSSGTYVRTLAHDLGQKLGCGAYLEELRRTAIGQFRVEQATHLDDLTKENWSKKLITAVTYLVAGG